VVWNSHIHIQRRKTRTKQKPHVWCMSCVVKSWWLSVHIVAEPLRGLGGPVHPQAPRFSPKKIKKIKILPQFLLFFFSNFSPPPKLFFSILPPQLGAAGSAPECTGAFLTVLCSLGVFLAICGAVQSFWRRPS
jgi:hypothetical protein